MKETFIPIVHHVNLLNWSTSVISLLVLCSVYVIALLRDETVTIPSFSGALNGDLEYMISSVLMSAQFVILVVLMYLRVCAYIVAARQKDHYGTPRFQTFLWLVIIGGVLLSIGSWVMSLIPESRSTEMAIVSVHVFYLGAFLHFIGSDLILAYIGTPSGILSRVCTWVSLLTIVLNLFMSVDVNLDNSDIASIGTTFGIVAFAIIQMKVTLIGLEGPKYALRMTGRNM